MDDKIYGLIGEKLGHSFSAEIHNLLGLNSYKLYELQKNELENFIKNPALGGINVTIPYKRDVMEFCDSISDEARGIGSVNTIVRGDDGTLHAYNTDEIGFEYMVRNAGISFSGAKVLIMGAGGTSLTACYAAKKMGAEQIVVMSRRGAVNFSDMEKHLDSDIVVNTTPVGMYPNNLISLADLKQFKKLSGVVDVVYNPHRTLLILQARELKIPYTDGLDMLVYQAKAAEELFFGKKIDDSVCASIAAKLRQRMDNIVLIGMPGSGKSSIGQALADISGKKYVDLDVEIEKIAGMSVSDIFSRYGERRFRELERETVKVFGRESGLIIACGGGVVLNESNFSPLKQNGRIYYITRDISKLATEGRPLSRSGTVLKQMYFQRLPKYKRFSNAEIENNGTINEAAEKIWEDFTRYANTCD